MCTCVHAFNISNIMTTFEPGRCVCAGVNSLISNSDGNSRNLSDDEKKYK